MPASALTLGRRESIRNDEASLDADSGSNGLINFPDLTSATVFAGGSVVRGSLRSAPTARFIVDFYGSATADPSGQGEGTLPGLDRGHDRCRRSGRFHGVSDGGRSGQWGDHGDHHRSGREQHFGILGCHRDCFSLANTGIIISDASVLEGQSGTTSLQFKVSLTAAPAATVTVDFATADGLATVADNDYLPASGTLSFTSGGQLSQTITVSVIGDTKIEPDETLGVNLSGTVGGRGAARPGGRHDP